MGVTLESTTNGEGVKALVGRAKPSGVKVGVLEGTGYHPNSKATRIAEVAFYNEFGTERNGKEHIKPRPFLRTALRENKKEYAKLMRRLIRAVLLGKMSLGRANGLLGTKAQADIRAKIVSLKTPANAEATKAKKKPKANPLVEDGHLRQAINYIGIKAP